MNQEAAYLNGKWIPASEAAVPVGDAGFVLGATIAEQLRTFKGKLFHVDDHLERLRRSLELIGIDPGMEMSRFAEIGCELVEKNYRLLLEGADLGLCIFVTPGPYPSYPSPNASGPTVGMHTYPLPFHLWAEKYRTGQRLATVDVRQVPPETLPPELKCRSRMHYYLADRQAAAKEAGARALLLDGDGFVTEASTANVLIYKRSEGLVSPPPEKILHGISLAVLGELAQRLEIPFVHRDLTPDDVASADEVLLSSTPLCLLPVSSLNGEPIGDSKPGEMFHRLIEAWNDLVGIDIVAQAERGAHRS